MILLVRTPTLIGADRGYQGSRVLSAGKILLTKRRASFVACFVAFLCVVKVTSVELLIENFFLHVKVVCTAVVRQQNNFDFLKATFLSFS